MGADGTVQVELKLLTAAAQKASKDFFSGMAKAASGAGSGGSGSGGSPVDKISRDVDNLGNKFTKLSQKVIDSKKALDAWRASLPKQQITDTSVSLSKGAVGEIEPRNEGAASAGPTGPFPKSRQFLQYQAALRAYNARIRAGTSVPTAAQPASQSGGQATQTTLASMANSLLNAPLSSTMAVFAKVATGLAAVRVAFGLFSYAINAALAPFRMFSHFVERAADNARRLYAGALTGGGLPLGFSVHRAQMASVLGVGEKEVYTFGTQVKYLSSKLAWSSDVMARATPRITAMSWEFEIMKKNIASASAVIVNQWAPAITKFLEKISGKIREFGGSVEAESKRWEAAAAFQKKHDFFRIYREQQEGGGYKYKFEAKDEEGKPLSPGIQAKLSKAFERFAAGYVSPGGIQPSAFANRYQTSPWERMGLVVGAGGANDYPRKTAINTDKMVQLLANIHNALSGNKGMAYKKYAGAAHP